MEDTSLIQDKNFSKLIKSKLQFLLGEENKTIRKVFVFSVEKIQDDPISVFSEIHDYVELHSDKIEDFHFESYIDENTFAPTLVMHIVPIEEIRKGMINSFWKSVTDLDIRPFTVSKQIEEVANQFIYEFNTPDIRYQMCSIIESLLKAHTTEEFKVTNSVDHSGNVFMMIDHENQLKSPKDFLIFLSRNNLLN
jgi:hypothetical protein